MKFYYFVILVSIFSCASSREIIGPDGTEHQLVSCEFGIEDCYKKASEVCGGKYQIVNTSSETSGSNVYISTSTKLLVKCSK